MTKLARMPSQHDLSGPVLLEIQALGGSARIGEIVSAIIRQGNFPEEIVNRLHKGSTSKTELEYRLDWARTNLKKIGYLDNSARSVWTLTAKAKQKIEEKTIPSSEEFHTEVLAAYKGSGDNKAIVEPEQQIAPNDQQDISDEPNDGEEWQVQLANVLQNIDPFAFERLCRRLLLEVGFLNVENTRRRGDGGFDGSGQMKINDLVNTNVIFECKRHRSQVGPDVVRRLRGTMQGKADYGLLIVTSRFSKAAQDEAAHPSGGCIELIDGTRLAELLQKYDLGIKTEMVEQVTVDAEWFSDL